MGGLPGSPEDKTSPSIVGGAGSIPGQGANNPQALWQKETQKIFKRYNRLLLCPGYYKQCCDEHWGTRVSFNSGFLGVYAKQWDC